MNVAMWRRRLIAAAVIVVLGGGGYLAWRLTHPPISDEERIARLLDRIEQGIETRSPRMILDTISSDYRDAFGYTKRDIHRLSLNLLRTEGTFQVVLDEVNIHVRGGEADANVSAEVTLTQNGRVTEKYSGSLAAHLRKQAGKWRIVSATGWQDEALRGFE